MSFLHRLIDMALPTARNSYRPRLLSKPSISFFLAVTLVAEAYFVSGLFGVNPSEPFLAAAAFATAPSAANWVLGAVVVLLGVLLLVGAAVHMHIQPSDVLLQGVVVVGIALLLLVLNAWYGIGYV